MKIVVIVLLLAVIGSLFAGLFFIYRDKGTGNRAVAALTLRIILSALIFVILIGSYFLGLVPGGRL